MISSRQVEEGEVGLDVGRGKQVAGALSIPRSSKYGSGTKHERCSLGCAFSFVMSPPVIRFLCMQTPTNFS